MNNQVQETARQILGQLSDIQAVVSTTGSNEVNIKLADIREKAAFLLEGKKGPEQIVAGYRGAAQDSLVMLGEAVEQHYGAHAIMDDADLLLAMRLAEIFISRSRVYFERKARHMTVIKYSEVQGETND